MFIFVSSWKKSISSWPLWPMVLLLLIIGAGMKLCAGSPDSSLHSVANLSAADTAWVLVATALVLLMTPGLAFFYGGMVNRQSIVTCMFQSFIALGVVSILWIAVGFSLAFGDSIGGIIGDPRTFLFFRGVNLFPHPQLSPTIGLALFALFQMKFAIITPALISGAFTDRIRFKAFTLFMVLFTLLVYAPIAHWTWHPQGILHVWGILDFAGGTVVHMSAGFAGLAGAIMVRSPAATSATSAETKESSATPASIPFVLLGTGLLWFGWFGFNAGSALAANETAVMAFMNTHTAAAAAMIAWLLWDVSLGRKANALGAAIAAIVGLVAITPAAGYVTVGASIVIGMLAAIASNIVVNLAWLKSKLNDTLDVFACHGIGGVVGMILTAVFATSGGAMTGTYALLYKHLAACMLVGVYSFSVSIILYKLVNFVVCLYERPIESSSLCDEAETQTKEAPIAATITA